MKRKQSRSKLILALEPGESVSFPIDLTGETDTRTVVQSEVYRAKRRSGRDIITDTTSDPLKVIVTRLT